VRFGRRSPGRRALAQRGSRKRRARKQRRAARPGEATAPKPSAATPYSRAEQKNAAVRASLEPLRVGERPLAVTIGALVALAIGVANLIAYAAGVEIDGERPALLFVIGQSGLMLVAAWGMWGARYWAVLGMQALLVLLIVLFAVLVLTAANVLAVVVSLAVIGAAGTLFWFLIKAMARIQMPARR
jgi:hypothetical protein